MNALKCFTLFAIFTISLLNANANKISKDVYSCIFESGKTTQFKIANKTIPVPDVRMPAVLTGTNAKECIIYTESAIQNGIVLSSNSVDFMRNFTKDLIKRYNESCKTRDCIANFSCKAFTNILQNKIMELKNDEQWMNNKIAEMEESFKRILPSDKNCNLKIQSIFLSYKQKFYTNEKCINNIASFKDGYIQTLMDNSSRKYWSSEFVNCLDKIKTN